MGWILVHSRVCVCMRVRNENEMKLILAVDVAIGGEVLQCQNGDCNLDLDTENDAKVQTSQNFD